MLNWTHLLVATKPETSFAIATVLEDSDSNGGSMSEVIIVGTNANFLNSFKHFPNSLCIYDTQLHSINYYYLMIILGNWKWCWDGGMRIAADLLLMWMCDASALLLSWGLDVLITKTL